MKQILVISGKGGTGKTVIAGALAALVPNKVLADCDVDAANLHILLNPKVKKSGKFKSGSTAIIDNAKCTGCGKCYDVCRFSAIKKEKDIKINPISCEGCGFCSYVCPEAAITMKENETGEWFVSDTRFGPFVYAKLGIAEENSGKLVSLLKRKTKEIADSKGSDYVIIDGAPGIGCPVIASISGVELALVVTEPTLSGLHDADRVIKVARHFKAPVKLVINKYDLNKEISQKIEDYARSNRIELVGKIEFDECVVKATADCKTVIEYPECKVKEEIRKVWERLK